MLHLKLFLLGLLLSLNACAGQPSAASNPPGLQTGKEVKIGPERYVQLPGVRALKPSATKDNTGHQPLGIQTETPLLQHKGPWRIENHQQQRQAYQAADTPLPGNPVLWNPRTRQYAVITGELEVKLQDTGQATALAEEYGLQLESRFERLNRAYFTVPADQALELAERLSQDSRVVEAQPVLLERLRIPY